MLLWVYYQKRFLLIHVPIGTTLERGHHKWEVKRKLNPNDPEDRNKVASTGYTFLEEYLNEIGEVPGFFNKKDRVGSK